VCCCRFNVIVLDLVVVIVVVVALVEVVVVVLLAVFVARWHQSIFTASRPTDEA
jgi:hypothetical protein